MQMHSLCEAETYVSMRSTFPVRRIWNKMSCLHFFSSKYLQFCECGTFISLVKNLFEIMSFNRVFRDFWVRLKLVTYF